ncbi:MAG: hypothetical protein U9R19_00045 [Bacteroidota bacterium]|nr:hypothetical protein [Bacteroidota bacterium]
MRKIKAATLALVALFLMNSCIIISLSPCYTEKDVVYKQSFEGTWHDSNDALWKITPRQTAKPHTSYKLELTENGITSVFELHIAELENHYFLDFFPDVQENNLTEDIFLSLHRLPVHSFARMKFADKKIILNLMNEDWFKKQIESGQNIIPHREIEGLQILTATTEQIQKFLTSIAKNDKAFAENEIVLSKTIEE